MFRGPSYGGRSRATPTTLCQKCLQRDMFTLYPLLPPSLTSPLRHYSYECKVTAQERPYKARPSRTQQLLNPSLKPKLTTEVPNELLRKKGLADELLAKKEQERGRRSSRESDRRRRHRSRSYSSDSVSSISTTRSLSRSRSPERDGRNGRSPLRNGTNSRKRGRRSVSSGAHSSDDAKQTGDRNTRRRLSSFSPEQRGRRGRSGSSPMSHDHEPRQEDVRRKSRERGGSRGRRRNRSRGRGYNPRARRSERRSVSNSRSRSSNRMDTSDDRGKAPSARYASESRERPARTDNEDGRNGSRHLAPADRSPSPYSRRRSPKPHTAQNGRHSGKERRPDDYAHAQYDRRERAPPGPPPAQRERSLSPYSKRMALTRAMQNGR